MLLNGELDMEQFHIILYSLTYNQLDDIAFCLAKYGRFGPAIKNETTRIE